jgi:hypothetical protein
MRLNVMLQYIVCLGVSAFGAADLCLTWNYTGALISP